MQNNHEINPIQELSTFNRNSEILVKLLHKGIESGGFSLLDYDNVATIRSLTQSSCDVSRYFLEHANHQTSTESAPIEAIQFNNSRPKDNPSSSITDSVHNSDVTVENGIAHEQTLSSHRVSEFGENVISDDSDYHVSNTMECIATAPIPTQRKKRKLLLAHSDRCRVRRSRVFLEEDGDDDDEDFDDNDCNDDDEDVENGKCGNPVDQDDADKDEIDYDDVDDDDDYDEQDDEEDDDDNNDNDGCGVMRSRVIMEEDDDGDDDDDDDDHDNDGGVKRSSAILEKEEGDDNDNFDRHDENDEFLLFNKCMNDIKEVMEYVNLCCNDDNAAISKGKNEKIGKMKQQAFQFVSSIIFVIVMIELTLVSYMKF